MRSSAGMTLVEAIVIVSLFTLIMLVVMNSISSLYKINAYTIAQAYQVRNARTGTQALTRDIREMTFADDGTYPLARMEPHLIGFYSDIDRDDSVEYVEYELAATTFFYKRVYNATGGVPAYDTTTPDETYLLSEYAQNIEQGTSTFFYYDTNGNLSTPATPVTDISYVQIQLIINIDPVRDPGEFMLRSSAALRNVIENI